MRVIDTWVNVDMPSRPEPWQRLAAKELFKREPEDIFRPVELEELIDKMDEAGVEKSVLTLQALKPSSRVLKFAEKAPDRFAFSLVVDPRGGYNALKNFEAVARAHRVVVARVIPSLLNAPPNDRVYYPLFAKCCEMGLPISVNTGIPGPPLPGRCQDPMHLDDVCLFFPELTLIMAHGADPWWEVAIRLLMKYPNLYLKTSAYAPKYLPPCMIDFMNSRGLSKVMFGSDFPFLEMKRCVEEAEALGLSAEARQNFLHKNAARVLFS
ncbi:MAG: amidohydrolase [Candidatus Eremiobacteraeota bacterium]|nr:amidohydrolase [Candidatus Eremiobacteraeota bacterium]